MLWVQSEREEKKQTKKPHKNPNTCKHEAQEKYASWGSEKKIEQWQ